MATPSDYFLSDEENAAIFAEQIRPVEFGEGSESEGNSEDNEDDSNDNRDSRQPLCLLLAGQTGAGKSHAAPALAAALRRDRRQQQKGQKGQKVCHLVADTHKPYHPAFARLQAAAAAGTCAPGLVSAATGWDARRWLARACAEAAARRRDTLVESASRYPGDVAALTQTFARAGYRVCVVLLAAHAAQSRLGLLARWAEGEVGDLGEDKNSGRRRIGRRLTPLKIHDESYAGLSRLARWIDGDRDGDDQNDVMADVIVDDVLIVRRGGQVALAQSRQRQHQKRRQHNDGLVAQTLEAERRRPGVTAEMDRFAADVARLAAQHPERQAELAALAAAYAEMQEAGAEAEADEQAADGKEPVQLDAAALVDRLWSGRSL